MYRTVCLFKPLAKTFSLLNMKFINFFPLLGANFDPPGSGFGFPIRDPDPLTQLNPYPIRIRNTEGKLLVKD
jgi:hypothetical protein